MRRVSRYGPIAWCLLFVGACEEPVIVDDWGPPAGYAAISGTVRTAAGAPVAGVEVAFSRCGSPLGGFLGADHTDAQGAYRARGSLPPIGALPRLDLDTLRVTCEVLVGRAPPPDPTPAVDTLEIRFASSESAVVPQRLDLTIP